MTFLLLCAWSKLGDRRGAQRWCRRVYCYRKSPLVMTNSGNVDGENKRNNNKI